MKFKTGLILFLVILMNCNLYAVKEDKVKEQDKRSELVPYAVAASSVFLSGIIVGGITQWVVYSCNQGKDSPALKLINSSKVSSIDKAELEKALIELENMEEAIEVDSNPDFLTIYSASFELKYVHELLLNKIIKEMSEGERKKLCEEDFNVELHNFGLRIKRIKDKIQHILENKK